MVIQADIPPDLTNEDKAFMFQYLDANLNNQILYALLHGIYTGILAVALWNIFINKCWPIRRALVVVLVLLHALTTINFAANWSFLCSAFIENGQSFWTVYSKLCAVNQAAFLEMGIAASMSTILADSYIIWCCWMVWGQCWLIVLLPILSLISATVSKIIIIYHDYFNASKPVLFMMLYTSFVLVTTLWCTLLIIFRILTVTGVRHGAGSRLRVYHCFIEVLVESSALYSISLILFLAFYIRHDFGWYYLDPIVGIAKGVAPTLLVGRAAAGHTHPTEEHDESATVSTLHFQASLQPSHLSVTSIQHSTMQTHTLLWKLDITLDDSVSSATDIYSPPYAKHYTHHASSSQPSKCTIEREDVGIIANNRLCSPSVIANLPLDAVQLILLNDRFPDRLTTYDFAAVVGAGNIWDEVYVVLSAQAQRWYDSVYDEGLSAQPCIFTSVTPVSVCSHQLSEEIQAWNNVNLTQLAEKIKSPLVLRVGHVGCYLALMFIILK
ncbi:uncharacterized protein EV420DRAFT_1648076 [Desarmillaria tabescens]|uniref:Uncharacterized protein n=1 Tax=Armillaria tabescens TaxID=1929756 RepID=A0AA39MTC7_ARMTA|nr:uncharacterized protein EV420DRAFT_1648076 [Desarmillaria tabescens]KAK0446401.1 hypothetical protein EV420DRAFT_1648076 [Desarmillaria tabescens]